MEATRREFLQASAVAAGAPAARTSAAETTAERQWEAQWIWHKEQRTLPETFVFFRKTFELTGVPKDEVRAWVSGHARYQLWVNGQFVQRGPAPCDPRYWEVDPVNLAQYLKPGLNVIGAIVLHYGGGDGTYVPPSPMGDSGAQGFWFEADIPAVEGLLKIRTGEGWKSKKARCWKPGQYQRWFLRALQEDFDARLWPRGWELPEYDDMAWRPVSVSRTPPGRPNLPELPREGWHEDWTLRVRQIPLMKESVIEPARVIDAGWVEWGVPPVEYFDSFPEAAFVETRDRSVAAGGPAEVTLAAPELKSAVVTFDFGRTVLGYVELSLRAPEGAVAEILFVEKQVEGKLLLRTAPKFGQWLRVTAGRGETQFRSFEFDCFRYMQVLVRNSSEPVTVRLRVRERQYAYDHTPDVRTPDEAIARVIAACAATHQICSQDTIVDNMIRERQQYAGDLDHTKLASYYGFGEYRQPARMIETFAQGQNAEGWFPDSWPAWDRCARLAQRHLGLAAWGPLIDHILQFGIATHWHYLFTGDRDLIAKIYPRLVKFDQWLSRHKSADGLLPLDGYTWSVVWIDHQGYQSEADKHAAFNIYYCGFLRDGLAALADALGDAASAREIRLRAERHAARVRAMYFDASERLFVDNKPRVAKDGAMRIHERTLSMALLFGVFPSGTESRAVELMAAIPNDSNGPVFPMESGRLQMGFSYPLNAIWRYWALGRAGRTEVITRDFRERWAKLPAVVENGTLSENWDPGPSATGNVWCQNGPVPLTILYQEILGIWPLKPGFAEFQFKPQLGDLPWIEATVHTPRGPIRARAERTGDILRLSLDAPPELRPQLVLPKGAKPRTGALPTGAKWNLEVTLS
jgi:alpha-L-rhamnosidase